MITGAFQVAYKDAEGNTQYQTYNNNLVLVQPTTTPTQKLATNFHIDRGYETINMATPTRTKMPSAPVDHDYSQADVVITQEPYTFRQTIPVGPNKIVQQEVQGTITRHTTEARGSELAQQNAYSYPTIQTRGNYGKWKYDYTIDVQSDILNSIKSIKKNLNIPSAYSRLELNKLFHTKFNRFRVQYPDYFMNNTLGYVFFTRPDLNLFKSATDSDAEEDDEGSDIHKQIQLDPQLHYIMKANAETAKTLTKSYSTAHHFNPLLSNTVMSLDVSDESIDTLETGETFTGFKTQYAKSNIRSMTAGTISITFPETYNAALTQLHQLWCGYESGVYRGTLKPKEEYIYGKELDYACDIYYFLVDAEDMIIRYWCKYTGCFPLNVNKSIFSFSGETQINHPNLNVSYAYFAREDMNLINLHEFNNNAGGVSNSFRYKANYIPSLGGGGNTWSDAPFVNKISVQNGFMNNSELYILRYKPYTETQLMPDTSTTIRLI